MEKSCQRERCDFAICVYIRRRGLYVQARTKAGRTHNSQIWIKNKIKKKNVNKSNWETRATRLEIRPIQAVWQFAKVVNVNCLPKFTSWASNSSALFARYHFARFFHLFLKKIARWKETFASDNEVIDVASGCNFTSCRTTCDNEPAFDICYAERKKFVHHTTAMWCYCRYLRVCFKHLSIRLTYIAGAQ